MTIAPARTATPAQGALVRYRQQARTVSEQAARAGEPWVATCAQLAADYAAFSQVLTSGETGAVYPRSTLVPTPADLGPSVAGGGGITVAQDCAQVVTTHRESIVRRLPGAAAAAVNGQLDLLGHLTGLPTPTEEQVQVARRARAGSLSAHDFRHERQTHARWLAGALQVLLARRGVMSPGAARALEEDIFRVAHRSDLAAFEAHQAAQAVNSGDWTLVSLEVSWRMAALGMRELDRAGLPTQVSAAIQACRSVLAECSWVNGEVSEPQWAVDLASV